MQHSSRRSSATAGWLRAAPAALAAPAQDSCVMADEEQLIEMIIQTRLGLADAHQRAHMCVFCVG